jgi:hypothetical protein
LSSIAAPWAEVLLAKLIKRGALGVEATVQVLDKECLARFYMAEARDLNEEIQIASRVPPALKLAASRCGSSDRPTHRKGKQALCYLLANA